MVRSSTGAMGVSICGMMMMMMMMIMGAAAQAPAPSPDCEATVLTMSDCLTFVTGSDKTPSANCCSELSSVIDNTPQCLCMLFNTTFTDPIGLNVTLAQQLPPACKLQTPPTSLCSLFGIPVPGPVSSAASSPAAPPSTATAPTSGPMSSSPSSMMAPAGSGPAPSPSTDCETVVLTMSDCLTFVTGSDKKPSANCCSELSSVIDNTPQCLCILFNTTFTDPLSLNVTLAQQLPPACKLETPPTSLCSLLGIPVPGPMSSAPASGPMSSSPRSPSMIAPAASNSSTTPNTGPSITSQNAALAASLLFLASIFLS